MFNTEGEFDVTIVEAFIGAPKFAFDPEKDAAGNSFRQAIQVIGDVIVKVKDETGNTGYWNGELSNRTGVGNFAQNTKTQMTLETLQKIGFNVQNFDQLMAQTDDNMNLPNLTGLTCVAVVEKVTTKKGKDFYNIKYLNASGSGAKRISKKDFLAAMQQGGFYKDHAPAQAQTPGYQAQPPQQAQGQPQYGYQQVQQAPPPQAQVQPQVQQNGQPAQGNPYNNGGGNPYGNGGGNPYQR